MLSVLIPTYNYVCAHLVCDLQKQCEEVQVLLGEDFDYEIIVADDGSDNWRSVEKNAVIECLPCCRFIANDYNLGRAAIRNLLVRESHGDWILIIDADAEVISDDFIMRYWQTATMENNVEPDVIIGGLTTPTTAPVNCELRHRYELASDEMRTIEARQKEPAMFFTTFNFMTARRVFDHIMFDERCIEYGYEDALFGIEVERCGFKIVHIDNPLKHNGINDNTSFLSNSETALRTLRHIGPPMTERARVSRAARQLTTPVYRKYTVLPLFLILYKMSRPLVRRNLLSHRPNLKLFAFYKLGYFLSLK